MAYVITSNCTKDELCVDACPVDCIHPKQDEPSFGEVEQLFVDPDNCIDCGACIPVCPTSSIYMASDVPADLAPFVDKNAAYYKN
jgi:NAD-dependent dihydropyrimidine dehydrogenase PreA subunit